MSQDASFIFNNKQGVVTQNTAQVATTQPTPAPITTPQTSNDTAAPLPVNAIPTPANPSPNTNAIQTQSLPDISTFSNASMSPTNTMTQQTPSVTETIPQQTVNMPASAQAQDEVSLVDNNLQSQTTQISQPSPDEPVVPINVTPTPDFRALAEEIITEQSAVAQPSQTQTMSPINQTISSVPAPTSNPVLPNLTEEPQMSGLNKNTQDIKLESDPFIQEVHEQDVKVEKEALEVLISSSRIEPELKDHLKIELLKFKDMENDIAPLDQSINSIAAEVMAPEPATPVVNPVQTIPPQQPM